MLGSPFRTSLLGPRERFSVARKKSVKGGGRQLRLFGVGDLGEPEDGVESDPADESGPDSWAPVMRELGLILRQGRFEAHLARLTAPGDDDSH